jgi:acyl-CoA thioester hydrolase
MSEEKIVYEGTIQVRFSDLDAYGHLTATHYVEMVGTSRLLVLEERFGVSMKALVEKGIGFYLTRTVVNYRKPVKGLVKIRQRSFVATHDGASVLIYFEVLNEAGDITHAEGELTYITVDLRTGKPIPVPDFLLSAF